MNLLSPPSRPPSPPPPSPPPLPSKNEKFALTVAEWWVIRKASFLPPPPSLPPLPPFLPSSLPPFLLLHYFGFSENINNQKEKKEKEYSQESTSRQTPFFWLASLPCLRQCCHHRLRTAVPCQYLNKCQDVTSISDNINNNVNNNPCMKFPVGVIKWSSSSSVALPAHPTIAIGP